MTHVTDDLELYALGALAEPDRARVAAHLADCPACREQSRLLEEVAIALPDTLPEQEVPARLRSRILATARADLAPAAKPSRGTAWTAWLRPQRFAMAALAVAVIVLALVDMSLAAQRAALTAQRDQYADVALRASHGGRNWYMAGLDQWAGSGGTLYAPAKPDASAFVVFHDLKPVERGSVYALWLIDGDGKWYRAANFTPTGDQAQAVILDDPVDGYTQCAVTVEAQTEGKRSGPVVMQSRISAPTQ
ncbi:MAG TPA: anti-sigma factor [Candidatus Limnocylindria bacterium]